MTDHEPTAHKTDTRHWVAACATHPGEITPHTWFPESQEAEAREEAMDLLAELEDGPS